MKQIFFIIIFIIPINNALAFNKNILIKKLSNIDNINFEFEQNINEKIETGECTIQYPKKIFCTYNSRNHN